VDSDLVLPSLTKPLWRLYSIFTDSLDHAPKLQSPRPTGSRRHWTVQMGVYTICENALDKAVRHLAGNEYARHVHVIE